MTFRIGATEVRITFGAVAFAACAIVAGEIETLLFAVLSLAVHEAAHAIAAKNLCVPVLRVTLYPFGAVMQLDPDETGRGEACIAAAGPLGSLLFAAFLRLAASFLPAGERIDRLIGTNLMIAAVNLLPAFPLDGGRIVRAALQSFLRPKTARTLLFAFTAVVSVGIAVLGAFLTVRGMPAWSMLAVSPFLAASAFTEWRMPDAGAVSRVMERKRAIRQGFSRPAKIVVLHENASVGTALASLSASRYTIFRIIGVSGTAELDETCVLDAAARFGTQTQIKTVISRLTDGK